MHSYLLTSASEPLPLPLPPAPAAEINVNSTINIKQIIPEKLLLSSTSSDDHSSKLNMSTELVDDMNNTKFPDELSGSVPPLDLSHQMSRKQYSRRLYSWPSREVDAFEGGGSAACVVDFVPKMKALESTAALSLATFTCLLIEFIARLDHLVEAVDHLARMAKFKP